MENRELMLLGLPSSFRFYHFVGPRTTGGEFCFWHDVGAGLSAGQFCAELFAGLFLCQKIEFC